MKAVDVHVLVTKVADILRNLDIASAQAREQIQKACANGLHPIDELSAYETFRLLRGMLEGIYASLDMQNLPFEALAEMNRGDIANYRRLREGGGSVEYLSKTLAISGLQRSDCSDGIVLAAERGLAVIDRAFVAALKLLNGSQNAVRRFG